VSEDDVDDLIGEFVVNGRKFKVVTSKVPTDNPDRIVIIRAGGIFTTDFYVTVPQQTHNILVEKGFVTTFLDMLVDVAPEWLRNLEDEE